MQNNHMHVTKAFLLPSFLLTAMYASSFAQKPLLPGHWEGAISRQGSVQLLKFDFNPVGDSIEIQYDDAARGFYNCFLEAPRKIAVTDTAFDINFGYGRFHCLVNREYEQITGVNKGWNPALLLHLKKTGVREEDRFTTEDISFKSNSIELAGSIYRPLTKGPCPFVILIHGSDEQTRRTGYIRSLVYMLTRNGIGVIVYDKRGTGHSEGNMHTAVYADFANDASACIRYIHSRKDLPVSRLGLLGTSEGGWIAPMVANKQPSVEFVILNAGPAVSTFQQEMDRIEYTLRGDGAGEKVIDSALQHTRLYFEVVRADSGWARLQQSVALYQTRNWATENNLLQLPQNRNDSDMRWWRSHYYDPAQELSHIKCRVLSLMGGSDNLVPPATNQPLMNKYLAASGRPYQIVILPNAGHNCISFQKLFGGEFKWPDHYWIWPKRAEVYYESIINWIKAKSS